MGNEKDIIVTNEEINGREGIQMNMNTFINKASSDDGLDLEGDIYINVNGLGGDIYEAICSQIPTAIFFTTDGNVPNFITNKVENWQNQIKKNNSFLNIADNSLGEESNSFGGHDSSITEDEESRIKDLFDASSNGTESIPIDQREAKVYLFGSSKGGTGKTFTCLISAYRYAKTHPTQRIAISDFDIIDGQVGISIHKVGPTMYNFFQQWNLGNRDFNSMETFKVKSEKFPENVDFYLAPKDMSISNNDFWETVFVNLIRNYDVVFFDSGIDYLGYPAISTLYKIADKIILTSTTSIKSVSSVTKQINKLRGEIENPVFSKDDEIGDKLNLVITQCGKDDEMNATVFNTFNSKVKLIGVFGVITSQIQKAEYFGSWDVFDHNKKFNQILDRICE